MSGLPSAPRAPLTCALSASSCREPRGRRSDPSRRSARPPQRRRRRQCLDIYGRAGCGRRRMRPAGGAATKWRGARAAFQAPAPGPLRSRSRGRGASTGASTVDTRWRRRPPYRRGAGTGERAWCPTEVGRPAHAVPGSDGPGRAETSRRRRPLPA